MSRAHVDQEALTIDASFASRLIAHQFPEWKDCQVSPVKQGGWDNRSFRLGNSLLIRMPSAEKYSAQVEKEQEWLPKLNPWLPLSIPEPVAMGEPGQGYPWRWSVLRWLEGDSAASGPIASLPECATRLAEFLSALQRVDASGGPSPGPHNFYRGGSLLTYDAQVRQALDLLKGRLNVDLARSIWEEALATQWHGPPVWVHGDMSASNLLVQGGQLSSVIDWGMVGVGDPACDLSIHWTPFEGESRRVFRDRLPLDAGTWVRGRAWTLWKAVIIAAGVVPASAFESAHVWRVINAVLEDR